MAGALAFLHPGTWREPFGLVLIEAMACGTPVLGARLGSVPEIVVDGATGFVCDGVDDAVAKVGLLGGLARSAVRARVESAFSIERMVDGYLEAYRTALTLVTPPAPSSSATAARAHDHWDRPVAFTEIPPRPQSLFA